MEKNPYGYDQSLMWQTQPGYALYPGATDNQQPGAPQAFRAPQGRNQQAPEKPQPTRMPKGKALRLAGLFKKSLLVASLATFASFSGLIAYHQFNTTSNQKSATSTSSTQNDQHTFFNQQGDDNLGASTPTATATPNNQSNSTSSNAGPSGGPGFGPGSGPASGTHSS